MSAGAIRRTESRFAASGDDLLFRRGWVPERSERAVVLVHGFAEHCGRYEEFATWLAARGCAVHAYDQRGHGHSPGPRGHLKRFRTLLDDLEAFVSRVEGEHPGLPLALIGHSMGGLVVTSFLRERQPSLPCAAVTGPMLALPPDVSRVQVWLARLARWVAPRARMAAPIDPDALSRDPEVGRRYVADPLVFGSLTLSMSAELFGAVQRVKGGGAEVGVPFRIHHGEADPLCPVEGSRDFAAGLTRAGSGLETHPGLRHELLNEPERETIYTALFRWIEAHPAG